MKTLLAKLQLLKQPSSFGPSYSDRTRDLQSSVSAPSGTGHLEAQVSMPLTSSAAVFLVPYN
ncbi:hypothetical protein [Oceanospirillum sanctuarii]|uniref:hypothetical protein n=1 Tax=Oceanospirillum sanctuarii TaxID=1434821 RepID=UPI000A3CF01D|nr:hypothetical protein [Oceanospirillum sanctuarii]